MPAIPKIYIFTGQTRSKGLAVEVKQRLKEEKNIGDEVEILVDPVRREWFLTSPEKFLDTWGSKKVLVLLNIQGADKPSVLRLEEVRKTPVLRKEALDNRWLVLFNGMEEEPKARREEVFKDYNKLVYSEIAELAMSFQKAVDIAAAKLINSGAVQHPYEMAMHQV